MAVLRKMHQERPDDPEYRFHCPGCNIGHWFKTTGGEPCWTWNGDVDRPTINPSLLVRFPPNVCHSYVTDGQIRFLSDCTHDLAGQTVPLPQLDSEGDPV